MSSQASQKLKRHIIHSIQERGAMPVSEFMETVLGHPEWGYYMRQDPFGEAGDFITAPEISQMFGELVGLWLADVWAQFGSPSKFILLECGPGRGTLMSDVLRVTKHIAGFHDAVRLHLLETSPVLRQQQDKMLGGYNAQWHERLDSLPDDAPLFALANEFFDALSMSQYEFTAQGWCERKIAVKGGALIWQLEPVDFDPSAHCRLSKPDLGKILEISPARDQFMNDLAGRIKCQTGAGLILDYGYFRAGYGDTFQAVRKHEFIDPLTYIGDADLTSHVNFDALETMALESGLSICGKTTQGEFLKNLGIQVRASKLLAAANKKQADDIQKALHRLTHSDEMGTLFKVMGIGYGPDIKPAGF